MTPKLKADVEGGAGGVAFPPEWEKQGAILRADLLKDWINILQREYENAVREAFPCPPSSAEQP